MIRSLIYIHKYKEAMRSLFLLAFVIVACQQVPVYGGSLHFSGESALELVEEQMTFGPRFPGSSGHAITQEWIVEELTRLGWEVERQRFDHRGKALMNIIASPNVEVGSERIVLGAHYDTRQFADRDPQDQTQAVPGANDGASGVAVLLELARIYAKTPPLEIILVFFDGEDQGHIDDWDWSVGSRYFVEHFDSEISAAIIVDMVGDRDLSLPYELSSDPDLVQSIWQTALDLGSSAFVSEPGPSLIDDHIPFRQYGIPAVDIIDFTYPYWHTSTDQLDKISADSLHQVGATLEAWINKRASVEIESTQ